MAWRLRRTAASLDWIQGLINVEAFITNRVSGYVILYYIDL